MALDDVSPVGLDEASEVYFHHRDGRNRWFDKSLVVIVTRNGRIGISGEHTPQDAPAPSLMLNIAINLESEEQYDRLISFRTRGLRETFPVRSFE